MDERPPIVIVKRKKKGHDAAHGGAWKVAYADFVTAMMAFFLVMWLVTSISPEKKASVSKYFRTYSIFDKESGASVMLKSSQALDTRIGEEQKALVQLNAKKKTSGTTSEEPDNAKMLPEDIVKKLQNSIDEQLASFKDQVLVDTTADGVRIQIVDAEGSLMFPLGSAQPTEKARDILKLVSKNLKEFQNKVVIEGHTDAAPFRGAQTTNWELSTGRASAARRELEKNNIESARIARVIGYADQELYIKENPRDPRNRRISIILLNRIDPPPLNQ
jgi:chemotaxis protein MotB